MKVQIAILTAVLLCLVACSESTLVDTFHELPANGWEYKHTVTDSFSIEKNNHYHYVAANLRVSSDYAYANIHLLLTILAPDGTTSERKIAVPLAEKSGRWLGSGLGDIITFQQPILHRKYFNQKGKYRVTIAQDMRLESLPNILSVGMHIEEQEEIF